MHPNVEAAIKGFLASICPSMPGYTGNITVKYIAGRRDGVWTLLQAVVILGVSSAGQLLSTCETENVRAGQYSLADIDQDLETFLTRVLNEDFPTPDGAISFPKGDEKAAHTVYFTPFHGAGLSEQARYNAISITGDRRGHLLLQPAVDWELRGTQAPFDSLQELQAVYGLNVGSPDNLNVEVVAFHVAAVDFSSPVSGTQSKLKVRLANGLERSKLRLGYRVLHQGQTSRGSVAGETLEWSDGETFQIGETELEIPPSAVLQCFASYDGIAQHFAWLADPANTQNARRTVYETIDPKLEGLLELIEKAGSKGFGPRDFEAAIGSLFWMLGFSTIHLGGTKKLEDGADLLAATPGGDVALVECTTGMLKADQKLPKLAARVLAARKRLEESGNQHLSALGVIVTSRSREEIEADLEQAQRHGLFVIAKEGLIEMVQRTFVLPDAQQLYREAQAAVLAGVGDESVGDQQLPLI